MAVRFNSKEKGWDSAPTPKKKSGALPPNPRTRRDDKLNDFEFEYEIEEDPPFDTPDPTDEEERSSVPAEKKKQYCGSGAGSVNVNIRMDSELKKKFEDFCSDMGMTMTSAITIFAKKAVREYRIPFEIGAEIPKKGEDEPK